MRRDAIRVSLTMAVAVGGAAVALWFGVPAAALLGSAFAVTVAALAGVPVLLPAWMRNVAFTAIGCSLGAGITPAFFSNAVRWPLSLAVLTVVLVTVILFSSHMLVRVFGHARETAILATSPGALSYSLSLASVGFGDLQAITILQSVRLLLITLFVPPLLEGAGMKGAYSAGLTAMAVPYREALLILAGAYALGWFGDRRRVPAAHILAGVALSGLLHGVDLAEGLFPKPLFYAGLVATGAMVGTRFRTVSLLFLATFLPAALAIVAAAGTVSAAAAWLVSTAMKLPFGQVWIAYAPGGVETMAAMALSLDFDPAFVATHHLFRMIFLIVLLPVLLRRNRQP